MPEFNETKLREQAETVNSPATAEILDVLIATVAQLRRENMILDSRVTGCERELDGDEESDEDDDEDHEVTTEHMPEEEKK